jgi:excisionase family DNA binding protein
MSRNDRKRGSVEEHLSLAEAAGRMGISERTARRWIKSGKLRAYKPGRDYWIPESALGELVEESEVHPKAQAPPSAEQPSFNGLLEEERREQHLGAWKSYLSRRVEWCERVLQKSREDSFNNPFLSLDTAIQWAIYVGIESAQLRDAVRTEVRSYTEEVRSYTDADSEIVGELHTLLDRFVAVVDTTDVRVRAMMDEAGLTDEDKEQRLRLIPGSAA